MNFVSPFMLWGVLAAGIPIALHFFFRSRYRTVPWAAMKFLLLSIEQTSRRLKFQELLLLILRCTLLAVLALALARPLLTSSGGGGREAIDAVFLFDTSMSMGAREKGNEKRLDFAKQAAKKILTQLPPYSTVRIVVCSDRAELVVRDPSNFDQAREVIDALEPSDLATDLAPGASEALAALARCTSPNKELYVFSDMHKLGWEQQAGALKKSLTDVNEKANVYLVRCGTQSPRNVAVVGLAPQSGIPRPGEKVGFAVLVRNTGSLPVLDVRVALSVDGKDVEKEEQVLPKLEPGETRAVTVSAKMESAGRRVLGVRLRQDDLEGDNQYYQVINVREQVRVLVVDGAMNDKEPERSSSYFLMHALTPVKSEQRGRYHIRTTLLSPRRVTADDLERNDVCILVNVRAERDPKRPADALTTEFLDRLGTFVKNGGGLIVFGGDNVVADEYNRLLGKRLGVLPASLTGFTTFPLEKPMNLDRNTIAAPSFVRFKQDEDYKDLSSIEIWKTLDIADVQAAPGKGEDGARVLARYGNGKPALVARAVGAGEVLLFGTSAGPEFKPKTNEPAWNYLMLWPGYVPLIEASLNHLLARQAQNNNATAGETITWQPPPDQADKSFVLLGPPDRPGARARIPLGRPKTVEGRPLLTAAGMNKAGVWTLTTSDAADPARQDGPAPEPQPGEKAQPKPPADVPFAVVPDLRETANLETLSEAQLDERLGFRAQHLTADAGFSFVSFAERTNREWTTWLLVLALILAVCEMTLAWFCGRAW